MVASGGHSHIVLVEDWCRYKILGRTVDDAAGEAYDKVARTLGLPYPGGPSVAAAARGGNPKAYRLPVPHVEGKYNVSFSGLKTAVINEVHNAEQKGQAVNVADMAASFQERLDQILAKKLLSATADTNASCLLYTSSARAGRSSAGSVSAPAGVSRPKAPHAPVQTATGRPMRRARS